MRVAIVQILRGMSRLGWHLQLRSLRRGRSTVRSELRRWMESTEHVTFVLKLAAVIGPIALYFLTLGLIHSQSSPYLIRARSDFIMLTLAVAPLMFAPIWLLTEQGMLWMAGVFSLVALIAFWRVLPAARTEWVVYNVGAVQCRSLLVHACRSLGWQFELDEQALHLPGQQLSVELTSMPILRTCSLQIKAAGSRSADSDAHNVDVDRFIQALAAQAQRESMVPSASGAGLVIVGSGMLAIPLWYLSQNAELVVNALKQLLLA
jgi:hypothetical protein